MIKIDFEFQTNYGVFRDAIHLPVDHTFTEAEIEATKQQRVDDWLRLINTPATSSEDLVPLPATPADTIEVAGETYQKLDGMPASGAKLIEVNGVWYFKKE
jgi:hypothetical protein